MPKKFLFLFFVIFSLLFGYTTSAFATQAFPTQPTCDLCGWCQPNPKPPNWTSCRQCLYFSNGVPKQRTYYTVLGCLSTEPVFLVRSLLTILIGISGGTAFLSFLGGSALVLTSGGDPERLQSGKDTITSSLLGIFLIIFSVFLLRVIGVDILRIPGFG